MRRAIWIGFIWRLQDHYAAELLARAQSLKEDAEIPVAQTIANEQKAGGGKRLLHDLGEQIRFGGHVREERQIIVFGQNERLGNVERSMQMEHQRIGRRWFVARFFFENRFHVLQNVLPAADLAAGVFQCPFESAHHEVVVIVRDDNWQRKTSENTVRFT